VTKDWGTAEEEGSIGGAKAADVTTRENTDWARGGGKMKAAYYGTKKGLRETGSPWRTQKKTFTDALENQKMYIDGTAGR